MKATYDIVLAHEGRNDETVIETRTVTDIAQCAALMLAIRDINQALAGRADKAYYCIRPVEEHAQ